MSKHYEEQPRDANGRWLPTGGEELIEHMIVRPDLSDKDWFKAHFGPGGVKQFNWDSSVDISATRAKFTRLMIDQMPGSDVPIHKPSLKTRIKETMWF